MIPRRAIICLGLSQLIGWGVSFYLIGNFGPAMQAELGWSAATLYGGLSAGIVGMALVSPLAGRAMDHLGGHIVMPAGAVLVASGCVLLASAQGLPMYYAAWSLLGVGMRLTLYDAAFAALARIGGTSARRAMSQITLFGGLASTVMWPVGQMLASALGWRGAVLAYAVLALLTIPLHRALPAGRHAPRSSPASADSTLRRADPRGQGLAQVLYALIVMLTNFLTAGNATHLIAMLADLGLAAQAAVGVSALWGIGQVSGRLGEWVWGKRVHPLSLNLGTAVVLPLCFVVGMASHHSALAAAFAFCYGACNGLLTITRGTLPLVLFDPRRYGALVGKLLVPSFLLMAASPVIYAEVITRYGSRAAMLLSGGAGLVILGASLWLSARFRRTAVTIEAV